MTQQDAVKRKPKARHGCRAAKLTRADVPLSTAQSGSVFAEPPIVVSEVLFNHPRTESRTPAATAEPITPATFGPIACMSRKLDGLVS